jgi:hypothetical protein
MSICQRKLDIEICRCDRDLRRLVGHTNILYALLDSISQAEQKIIASISEDEFAETSSELLGLPLEEVGLMHDSMFSPYFGMWEGDQFLMVMLMLIAEP